MRAWLLITGGLIVWATHFIAIYAAASVFPGQAIARWMVLAATAAALGANASILYLSARRQGDQTDRWVRNIGQSVIGISTVAIIFQAAPAMSW